MEKDVLFIVRFDEETGELSIPEQYEHKVKAYTRAYRKVSIDEIWRINARVQTWVRDEEMKIMRDLQRCYSTDEYTAKEDGSVLEL